MGFAESSVFLKVCLVVFPLSVILQSVGIATPNWLSAEEHGIILRIGLWKACQESICVDIPSEGLAGLDIFQLVLFFSDQKP